MGGINYQVVVIPNTPIHKQKQTCCAAKAEQNSLFWREKFDTLGTRAVAVTAVEYNSYNNTRMASAFGSPNELYLNYLLRLFNLCVALAVSKQAMPIRPGAGNWTRT